MGPKLKEEVFLSKQDTPEAATTRTKKTFETIVAISNSMTVLHSTKFQKTGHLHLDLFKYYNN